MIRFLKVVLLVLIILTLIAAGIFFGIGFWLSPQDKLTKADAIVAISGGETESRAREAIRLYHEGYAPTLIFSGAALDPHSPSNAAAMQRQALISGVPKKDILLEEDSANTYENAAGVARIVKERQYKSILLVTSPYHQRRASLTFQHELGPDVKIINHSTTDQNWRRSKWWDDEYSKDLTIAEFQKAMFVWLNGAASQNGQRR